MAARQQASTTIEGTAGQTGFGAVLRGVRVRTTCITRRPTPVRLTPHADLLFLPDSEGQQMQTTLMAPPGLLSGLPPDNSQMAPRPDRLAVAWLSWMRDVRECSDNTVGAYAVVLTAWIDWCDGMVPVDPLCPTLTDLESFTTRPLRNGARRSPSTRRVECAALKGWFGWLHKRRLIDSDPTMELVAPKGQGRKRRPVPDEHWLPLWQQASDERHLSLHALKLYLALGLAMFCGLRLSEVGQLTGSHVQADMLVGVIRKGGKECDVPWLEMVYYHHEHPALRHLLPNPDDFRRALTAHAKACGSAPLFWLRAKTFREHMRKLCERGSVARHHPHELRHSCASHLVNEGQVPIQVVRDLLNHESIRTTQGYVDVAATALRDWRRRTLGASS